MALTVHTARNVTRRLTHDQAFTRSRLDQISKKEESGVAGATEERLKLTAFIQKDVNRCNQAIADTRSAATRYAKAASILRNGTTTATDDPLHTLCADLVRMDGQTDALADQMQRAADSASQAAEISADRMAKAAIDIRATAALASYLARLADVGFKKTKSTENLRHEYLALRRAAKGK